MKNILVKMVNVKNGEVVLIKDSETLTSKDIHVLLPELVSMKEEIEDLKKTLRELATIVKEK